MPGRPRPPVPPFPWGEWSGNSSDRGFKRASSRSPLTSDGQSKTRYEYESKPPAVIIGSFELVNGDKMVKITTPETTARPNPFMIHIAAGAKQALKISRKATKTNQAANSGMGLVHWKKKNGSDATLTWYSPFADHKLDTRLSKQGARNIYGRWLG